MEGYNFNAKAKFPDGRIEELVNENAIHKAPVNYTSPDGEEMGNFASVYEKGTYEYRF